MLTAEKSILDLIHENKGNIKTPYYLLDEQRLQFNGKILDRIRNESGAKCVLALKCFSTWSVFDAMRPHMDGTTSSSLFEARLGHEKFGKEVHAYSVAFSDDDISALREFSSKIIFNSVSQLKRNLNQVKGLPLGLRVNPGVSHSGFDLADPARKCSRLGATDMAEIMEVSSLISGVMFHCQCENDSFESFSRILEHIGSTYQTLLKKCEWISLGGGIYFTKQGYPVDLFIQKLSNFSKQFNVQIYLEPGESSITQSGYLVTSVLDIVRNEADIAIVDAAVETHMLDLLIYKTPAKLENKVAEQGGYPYTIAGRTCLAGDIFGSYVFPEKLDVGSLICFSDAAGYTMVKKNWFNGVAMPSIVVRRLDGRMELVKQFDYEDYRDSLS